MIGPPTCTNCGEPTEFQTRISLPRQTIFRCPSCKAFRYMADETSNPVQGQQQQQIQPDDEEPKSS